MVYGLGGTQGSKVYHETLLRRMLFTPIVFALLMAAGETILKRAVQPMLDLAMKPLLRVLLYLLRQMSRAARVVCSPLRLLRLLLMAVQSVASRQADVAEAETVEESLALPEASPTLPSASAAAEASRSATVPTPPVPAASPTESRRSSTTSPSTGRVRPPRPQNGRRRCGTVICDNARKERGDDA
eukprot:symbB.v1.2.004490.t1/scaffold250.1/size251770/1